MNQKKFKNGNKSPELGLQQNPIKKTKSEKRKIKREKKKLNNNLIKVEVDNNLCNKVNNQIQNSNDRRIFIEKRNINNIQQNLNQNKKKHRRKGKKRPKQLNQQPVRKNFLTQPLYINEGENSNVRSATSENQEAIFSKKNNSNTLFRNSFEEQIKILPPSLKLDTVTSTSTIPQIKLFPKNELDQHQAYISTTDILTNQIKSFSSFNQNQQTFQHQFWMANLQPISISQEFKVNSSFQQQQNANSNLKYIIIDGSNVAMDHGKKTFSSRGIQIAVDYFIRRGHKNIIALVPRFRRNSGLLESYILDDLESKGYLSYTPSRYLNGKLIVPYDDRFILEAAEFYDAVIVSNDNYSDIKNEKPQWRHLVDNNLLQFTFVGDLFLVADDPMGRNGPSLDKFLKQECSNKSKDCNNNTKHQPINYQTYLVLD